METLQNIIYGFNVVFTTANLFHCFIGVLMGALVGVLPGIGPPATIALLLPLIYHAPPIASLIMLAGICYGAQYGGSTTSILLNMPGEVSSIATCIDGYQMARQGRAGAALGISAFGSFIAGTISIVGLMSLAPLLADFAVRFGPPEFTTLALMSLTLVTYLGKGSLVKGLIMACMGIFISTVGMDPMTSRTRFTFGIPALLDGFEIVFVAMGIFGMSEVLTNLDEVMKREVLFAKIKNLLPSRQDWQDAAKPIVRGTLLGFFMGIIPGLGISLSTFMSYAMEKKLSKHREKFGNGAIEGVAGPEAANNAGSTGTFIPLLSLGIPTNPSTALILGALLILGIQPGPLLISSHPDLFWGVIASMYIGNVMLVVLNLPLIGLWVQVLKVPYSILAPLIVITCEIAAYNVNSDWTGVLIMNFFGLIGYFMKRYDFSGTPFILGLVLGPMFEISLRRSLILSEGSPLIFFTRPLAAVFVLIALVSILSPLFTRSGKRVGEDTIEMLND